MSKTFLTVRDSAAARDCENARQTKRKRATEYHVEINGKKYVDITEHFNGYTPSLPDVDAISTDIIERGFI